MSEHYERIWHSFADVRSAPFGSADLGPADPTMTGNRFKREMLAGYVQLVEDRVQQGFQPSLITFMFRQLAGSPQAVIRQMRDEVERVFATFLTRVVRDPRSPRSVGRLPVLIACADLPVAKREKRALREVTINGGLHYAGVLLVPPQSRLRVTAQQHFAERAELYLGGRRRLDRIDVRPVESDPARVVDYVMKSCTRGRLAYDNSVLVLPRARGELTC
jgi:hypothetical protein